MSNRFDCILNPNDYPGTCYSCQHYKDYGPIAGRFGKYNGKCTADGHETNALVQCKNSQYLALENEFDQITN